MIIAIIRLVVILIISVISSWTDITRNKIYNHVLLSGVISAIILVLFSFFSTSTHYYKIQIVNILALALFSIALYFLHIWAGGDCKLILTLSLLYPPELILYFDSFTITFPLIILLSFILSFIYLIFDSIAQHIKRKDVFLVNIYKMKLGIVARNFLIYYGIVVILDKFLCIFISGYIENFRVILYMVNLSVVFFLGLIKKKHWRKHKIFNLLFSGISIIILIFSILTSDSFEIQFANIILVLFIVIARTFVSEYNYLTIPTDNLQEGMILSLSSSLLFVGSKQKGLPQLSSENFSSRLTSIEAYNVRKWGKTEEGSANITIVRKMPFAIFISLSAILYIIAGVYFNGYTFF